MPVHRYAPLLCAAFFLLFVIAATQTFAGEQLNADQPLAGTKSGDAKAGKNVFIHRKKGNCLACHVVTSLDYILFHGEVGPPLDGVGSNLSEAEIRLQVMDPRINNPDTIMPPYHRTEGLNRVLVKYKDKTILSAQQVEDIVAYLKTLKDE
ncbi:MAG: sulfur oxidation c-type cytochrome SoxX [Rhodospirillaceae bacterium]|jgi:L-cysteine S-thiosulfotransferase|nr:sulfur oxidation c-type cytochrome SoxX [Rhodospirillaceae bacterium]MBT5245663.1 sulfur oxidation c-type cytochrome SoxX [Rhodospirillaceae bacterium]MBT5561238.1 sulfur oxidation c-type cytochrome SoxX [Rhodospirillaceae bacterium]MBT6240531.1 sulfur oxidation c-type cytochrome SoxX [Rhodospirillaceae bacterium]MBT7136602.1 sulfur oxidation c-type cytochrome SoxX [Rhodospirillaceae bacterium]